MMSAKEAKEKSQQVKFNISEEFNEIEKHIEESVLMGCFYITREGYISPQIKRYLEAIGYTIKTGCQYNEPYYSISWN